MISTSSTNRREFGYNNLHNNQAAVLKTVSLASEQEGLRQAANAVDTNLAAEQWHHGFEIAVISRSPFPHFLTKPHQCLGTSTTIRLTLATGTPCHSCFCRQSYNQKTSNRAGVLHDTSLQKNVYSTSPLKPLENLSQLIYQPNQRANWSRLKVSVASFS